MEIVTFACHRGITHFAQAFMEVRDRAFPPDHCSELVSRIRFTAFHLLYAVPMKHNKVHTCTCPASFQQNRSTQVNNYCYYVSRCHVHSVVTHESGNQIKNNVLPCTDLQQKTICTSVNQNWSKPTTAATQQLSLCNHYKTGPPGKTNWKAQWPNTNQI